MSRCSTFHLEVLDPYQVEEFDGLNKCVIQFFVTYSSSWRLYLMCPARWYKLIKIVIAVLHRSFLLSSHRIFLYFPLKHFSPFKAIISWIFVITIVCLLAYYLHLVNKTMVLSARVASVCSYLLHIAVYATNSHSQLFRRYATSYPHGGFINI